MRIDKRVVRKAFRGAAGTDYVCCALCGCVGDDARQSGVLLDGGRL